MYIANKPIFEFLYAFIRENFLEGSVDSSVFYPEDNVVNATAVLGTEGTGDAGKVVSINVSPDLSFSSFVNPKVVIRGGGGSGAVGTPYDDGGNLGIKIDPNYPNHKGSGYTSVPEVCFSAQGLRPCLPDRFFGRVDRGPIPLANLGDDYYPLAWLELGQITDVEVDRSPQGFSYELRYQLACFVKHSGLKMGRIPHETFRSDVNLPRGIGDIVSEVVEKAWRDLHVGLTAGGNFRFVNDRLERGSGSGGQLNLSDVNWWIKKWSVDVNGDIVDTISEWKDVIHNAPTSRSKTINWDFTVFEQQSLT